MEGHLAGDVGVFGLCADSLKPSYCKSSNLGVGLLGIIIPKTPSPYKASGSEHHEGLQHSRVLSHDSMLSTWSVQGICTRMKVHVPVPYFSEIRPTICEAG